MRCWKCGQEIMDGTSVCTYCGASQARPEPVTEAGRAMRSLYDRYSAREVLTNGAYLTSGLSDLVDDSKKLRNQLKMAIDAGIGRLYLEQLGYGLPDDDFDRRVKFMLTEDAGLSDKTAAELAVYFDEMIGWRVSSQPRTQAHTQQGTKGNTPGPDKTGHGSRDTAPGPGSEINRNTVKEPVQGHSFARNKLYPYEGIMFFFAGLLILLVMLMLVMVLLSGGEFPLSEVRNMFGLLTLMMGCGCYLPLIGAFCVRKRDLKRIGSVQLGRKVVFLMLFVLALPFLGLFWPEGKEDDTFLILSFAPSGLLFLQMVRHRIMESKLPKM